MNIRGCLKKTSLFLITMCCIILLSASIKAQVIAFDTVGLVGNEASLNSTTTDPNLNVSQLTRGGGINPSTLANSFNSANFTLNGTFANAVANGDFLQFTVSPKSGFKVSLSTLNANFRRSGTGPNMFQYQYSLDGFATAGINIGSAITFTDTDTDGVAQPQIDLSSIPALQNVAFPKVITFRLYGWGATSAAGTFAIGRVAGNDLAIGGMTSVVTTAASATVSGRVTQPNGRGIFRARVTMTDSQGNERTAYTNQHGFFNFTDIPTGETYVFTTSHLRYQFAQSSQIQFIGEDIGGINFVGIDGNEIQNRNMRTLESAPRRQR